MSSCCIIVNADDLGVSAEVNDAIFELMEKGRVTSATMLANGAEVAAAAGRVKEFPHCSFGAHLNLTQFKPLTTQAGLTPILNEAGEFAGNRVREIPVDSKLRTAIYHEWHAQIKRLQDLGVELSHIDSHHHVHTTPALFPVVKRIQKAFSIRKVRQSMNLYSPKAMPASRLVLKKNLWNWALRNYFATTTTTRMTDLKVFLELAGKMNFRGEAVEVMVHPGGALFVDETEQLRGRWLEALPFPAQLISYRDL